MRTSSHALRSDWSRATTRRRSGRTRPRAPTRTTRTTTTRRPRTKRVSIHATLRPAAAAPPITVPCPPPRSGSVKDARRSTTRRPPVRTHSSVVPCSDLAPWCTSSRTRTPSANPAGNVPHACAPAGAASSTASAIRIGRPTTSETY